MSLFKVYFPFKDLHAFEVSKHFWKPWTDGVQHHEWRKSLSAQLFLSVSHTQVCLEARPYWETAWCVMKWLTAGLAKQRSTRGAARYEAALSCQSVGFSDPSLSDLKTLTGFSGFLHRCSTLSAAVFKRSSFIFNRSIVFDKADENIK